MVDAGSHAACCCFGRTRLEAQYDWGEGVDDLLIW